jgi:hypothetical protein
MMLFLHIFFIDAVSCCLSDVVSLHVVFTGLSLSVLMLSPSS